MNEKTKTTTESAIAERNALSGVLRENRISEEGLMRLERQMQEGAPVSKAVLAQWVKRYGDPAREVLRRYGQYDAALFDEA